MSAVYKCILPVKKPPTMPSTIYHSPTGHSGETPQTLFYQAWPEIDDPIQWCCLPRLLRATYFLDLDVFSVESEELEANAEAYVLRPGVIAPEMGQQILALAKAFIGLPKDFVEIDDFSPLGVYGKKRQISSDAYNACLDFVRLVMDGHTIQSTEAIFRAIVYGYLQNFPGVGEGDFSHVYSWLHEIGHYLVRFSHSGVIQDEWSKRRHQTLHTLSTKSLSPKQIAELWKELERINAQSECLAQKFEPIEEIFATYVGLHLLSTEEKEEVNKSIAAWLEKRNWQKAYEAFGAACAKYQYSSVGLYWEVFEVACQMLEQVDIDCTKLLSTIAQTRRVVWSHTTRLHQEHGSNLDAFKLEIMAEKEAAEEINRILEEAGIRREIYWSAVEMETSSITRRSGKSLPHGFSLSDAGHEMLFAPVILLKGKFSSGEITPQIISFHASSEDADGLSPSIRIFCESLCQQLSKPCGLVCPFAYQGKPCCGKQQLLQTLFERLPENMKCNHQEPNCDQIR